jgi:hypothetical protein
MLHCGCWGGALPMLHHGRSKRKAGVAFKSFKRLKMLSEMFF